jgi:hypothetical protein
LGESEQRYQIRHRKTDCNEDTDERILQAGGSGCALRWDSAQVEEFIAGELGENGNAERRLELNELKIARTKKKS